MAIQVTNVNYKRALDSTEQDFLISNVGEWGLLSVDFNAYPYVQPTRSAGVSIVNPDIMRLDDGTTWHEKGFKEGDNVTWKFNIKNISTGGSVAFTKTFDVLYIDDNVLYAENISSGGFFADQDLALPSSFVGASGENYSIEDNLIYVTSLAYDFRTIEIDTAKVLNSTNGSVEVNAAIDGTTPTWAVEDMVDTLGKKYKASNRALISGSDADQVLLQREFTDETITVGGYSLTVPRWKLDILFNTALFGESYNFTEDEDPTYFFDKESITDGLKIRCYRDTDDNTVAIEKIKPLKKGRAGYLDETYRGIPSSMSVSDITYSAENEEITSLAYNSESTIEFYINNLQGLDSNTRFQFGLAVIPTGYSTNKNSILKNYQLVTGLNGFENFEWRDDDVRAVNFNYYTLGTYAFNNEGYGDMNMQHIQIEQVANAIAKVRLTFSPSSNATLTDADNFCVFASVDGVQTLKVDYQNFQEYEPILGSLRNRNVFYPSYMDRDTDAGIFNLDTRTVDDICATGFFNIPSTLTNIIDIEFRVQAVNGSLKYDLERQIFETDGIDLSILNLERTTNISSIIDDRNTLFVKRNPTYDWRNQPAFEYQFPFRSRWEYWIERLNTPDVWYQPALPNYGRNNDWIDYLNITGTTIEFAIYVQTEEGSYRVFRDITPKDYNDSTIETTIKVYRTSDDALLWSGENTDGFDEGYLLQNTEMYIEATHTHPTGWSADPTGWIAIERKEQSGQYEIQVLYNDHTPNPANPLQNITANVNGNDLVLRCDIDKNFVSPEFGYVVKSRCFERYEEDNGIGGIGGGNIFATNFDTNFYVPNSSYFG